MALGGVNKMDEIKEILSKNAYTILKRERVCFSEYVYFYANGKIHCISYNPIAPVKYVFSKENGKMPKFIYCGNDIKKLEEKINALRK